VTTVCRNAIVVSSKRRFALDDDPFLARADLQSSDRLAPDVGVAGDGISKRSAEADSSAFTA